MDSKNYLILKTIGVLGILWFFFQGANLFSDHPAIKILSPITSIVLAILGAILITRMSRKFKAEQLERNNISAHRD